MVCSSVDWGIGEVGEEIERLLIDYSRHRIRRVFRRCLMYVHPYHLLGGLAGGWVWGEGWRVHGC